MPTSACTNPSAQKNEERRIVSSDVSELHMSVLHFFRFSVLARDPTFAYAILYMNMDIVCFI